MMFVITKSISYKPYRNVSPYVQTWNTLHEDIKTNPKVKTHKHSITGRYAAYVNKIDITLQEFCQPLTQMCHIIEL